MVKPLKIATWNANRLAKHSQEIKTYVFSQNIDVLFVSETHFTNKSFIAVFFDIHCITQS
jgi:exonuclease III